MTNQKKTLKGLAVLALLATMNLVSCGKSSSSLDSSNGSSTSSTSSSTGSSEGPNYLIVGWSYAGVYQSYANAVKADNLSTEKKEVYKFMKKNAYRVGNLNSVNLFPIISAENIGTEETIILTTSSDVNVIMTKADGTACILADYLDDVSALKSKGIVKFKAGVTGDFVMTFKYTGSDTTLSDIVYNLNVVDKAYNITTANELVAMNNVRGANGGLYIGEGEIQGWLTSKAIPEAAQNADSFVIQSDLKINAENIPDCFLWDQADLTANGCLHTEYIGSLKDNVYLYEHALSAEHPDFSIYGNYHRIALGDPALDKDDKPITGKVSPANFPYIMYDRKYVNGSESEKGQPDGTLISSHSSLFGEDPDGKPYLSSNAAGDAICQPYTTTISDLYCTGNAGNSVTFDPTLYGGPTWFKTPFNSNIDNCIANTFSSMIDNSGLSEYNKDTGNYEYRCPTCTLTNTRLYDSYSLMILGYRCGNTNVSNCDIRNAGGPLFIVTAPDVNLVDYAGHLDWKKVNITVEADCGYENYSDGDSGWFAENGASLMVTQFKIYNKFLSYAPTATTPGFNMSYLKAEAGNTDASVGKINFLGLVQPDANDEEGVAGIPGIGMPMGNVTIKTKGNGDTIVSNSIDQSAGEKTVSDAFDAAAAAQGGTDDTLKTTTAAAYINALNTTDFGMLYAAQLQGAKVTGMGVIMPAVFKTAGADGSVNYLSNDNETCAFMANKFTGGTGAWDATILGQVQSASLISIYGFGRSEKNNWQTSFPTYKGAAPYGVIFGGFHTYAA